ncbi:MAG TPA: CHAT domain-containing protein, partial [Dongiaceae bacterium]|nr:CHAT domain-containing protein [Dongiaceae bacterium]
GRFDEAEKAETAALATLRADYGHDAPEVAPALHALGNLRRADYRHFRFAAAESLHREALAIRRAWYGDSSVEVAESLTELGLTLVRAGEMRRAVPPLEQAWAIAQRTGRTLDHRISDSGWLLMRADWALDDFAGVVRVHETFHLLERWPREFYPTGFGLSRVEDVPRRRIDALLRLGRTKEAWKLFDLGMGAIAGRFMSPLEDPDPSHARSARRDSLAIRLMTQRRLVRGWTRRSERERSPESARRLAQLRIAVARTEADLSAVDRAAFEAAGGRRRIAELTTIQHALDSDEALVGWLTASDGEGAITDWQKTSGWAFVLRRDGPLHVVPLWTWRGRREIVSGDAPFGRLDAMLHRASVFPLPVADDPELRAPERAVWDRYLGPVMPLLSGVQRLVMIGAPGVPFECLRDAEGRSLVDRFEVVYAPSPTLFLRIRRRVHRIGPASACLAIAGPGAIGPSPAAGDEPAAPIAARYPDLMHDAMLGDPGALSRLPPLLEAAGEARSIAACFAHATACETGFGSSAALDSLRDVLPRYQVIHLAAHALVDELDPGRSALVLARPTGDPADIDAGTAGGLLTAEDILLSWRIRADLVTLSGCRTGGGQGTQTGEFLGFTQALLGAGAAA